MKYRYEPISVDNISDVLELALEMHQGSPYADTLSVDLDYSAERLYRGIILNPDGYGRVVFDGDKAVGLIVGSLGRFDFSPAIFVYNNLWYVSPSHRGSMIAVRLLKGLQEWAKGRGAQFTSVSIGGGVNTERVGRLLTEKFGFVATGANYIGVLE